MRISYMYNDVVLINKLPYDLHLLKEIDKDTSIIVTIPATPPTIQLETVGVEVEKVKKIPIISTTVLEVKGLPTVCENCRIVDSCDLDKKKSPIHFCKRQQPKQLFIVDEKVAMLVQRKDLIYPDMETAERDEHGKVVAVRNFRKCF